MWSLLVITCVLFQTAVAMLLLNAVRIEDDVDKNLRALLLILLIHLSTKLLLLAVLGDVFMYTQIPTGFGLSYGPLLLVTVRSWLGRPLRRRAIFFQFLPFLVFSIGYFFLVLSGIQGWISRVVIVRYTSWYEWGVIASLLGYPIYVKMLLRRSGSGLAAPGRGSDRKARLLAQIANVLIIGISAGALTSLLRWTPVDITGFDLRLLPYICFAAIPLLILWHRLQGQGEASRRPGEVEGQAREMAGEAIGGSVEVMASGKMAVSIEEKIDIRAGEKGAEMAAVVGEKADKRYEKSGLDGNRLDEYEAALMAFMQKSRIYLDPDLSLDELASRMKMSRHYLTQVLNDRLMKNFYSFINEYRIGVAIAKLKDPGSDVNILSLAFDCGFNSRSSFNNYFKKITGYTPSAYRKMIGQGQASDQGPDVDEKRLTVCD